MTSRAGLEATESEPPRPHRELADAGIGWRRLYGPEFRPAARGWHSRTTTSLTTTQRIVEAARLLPPRSAVGGWAAAFLHGCDWLDGRDQLGRPMPVPLCVPSGVHRASNRRVRWVRVPPEELAVVRRHSLPVTTPARAVADAARWSASEEDALVVLDAALAFRITRPAAVRAAAATTSDRRGRVRLRLALELCADGVESPQESRLRFCWVREAELPPLLVNPELVDLRGGWLGRVDLFEPESGTVLEFDGDHHRDREQHRADNLREERLEAANLVVTRVAAADLGTDRRLLVARLRETHRRGLLRNPARDYWQIRRR